MEGKFTGPYSEAPFYRLDGIGRVGKTARQLKRERRGDWLFYLVLALAALAFFASFAAAPDWYVTHLWSKTHAAPRIRVKGKPASLRVVPAPGGAHHLEFYLADPQGNGAWVTAAGLDSGVPIPLKVTSTGTLVTGADPGGAIPQGCNACMVVGGQNGLQSVALKVGSDGTVAISAGVGAVTFDVIGSGTNTTAAMVVGTGGSLTVSGSGTINATTLGGATFAAPGAIGGTTPAAGTFTTLSATNTSGSGNFCLVTNCVLVTPTLGAATGTSLNLGATGVLSTTAQSGTGSLCMTTSCSMTTPALGTPSAINLTNATSFPSAVVQNNITNTAAAAMILDLSGATGATAFKVPVIAGATAGANGVIDYDSTNGNTHVRTNGADSLAVAEAAAITLNLIPKATDSTHGLVAASTLTDNGSNVTSTATNGLRGTFFLANNGTACANGDIALSAGWGSTASVSGVKGQGQTCEWTFTSSGTGQAAGPTITWTLKSTQSGNMLCTGNLVGGTGATSIDLLGTQTIDHTTLSATAPVFTLAGTPVAASTYIVVLRCGP